MKTHDLEGQMEQLERAFEAAPPTERMKLAPRVQQFACRLDADIEPPQSALRRYQTALKQDAYDDMFDNMPV